jgi:hypothetical protein
MPAACTTYTAYLVFWKNILLSWIGQFDSYPSMTECFHKSLCKSQKYIIMIFLKKELCE